MPSEHYPYCFEITKLHFVTSGLPAIFPLECLN